MKKSLNLIMVLTWLAGLAGCGDIGDHALSQWNKRTAARSAVSELRYSFGEDAFVPPTEHLNATSWRCRVMSTQGSDHPGHEIHYRFETTKSGHLRNTAVSESSDMVTQFDEVDGVLTGAKVTSDPGLGAVHHYRFIRATGSGTLILEFAVDHSKNGAQLPKSLSNPDLYADHYASCMRR